MSEIEQHGPYYLCPECERRGAREYDHVNNYMGALPCEACSGTGVITHKQAEALGYFGWLRKLLGDAPKLSIIENYDPDRN